MDSVVSRRTEISFMQEMVNSAAVVLLDSLDSITRAKASGAMRVAAIALALHHGVSSAEIEGQANVRARSLKINGEDLRRERELFDTLLRFALH